MCDTVGCDRKAIARGLCQYHYQRQWHARHPGYRAHAAAEWRKANPLQVVVHNVARRKRRVCERCGATFTTGSYHWCPTCWPKVQHDRLQAQRQRRDARKRAKRSEQTSPG